MAKTIAFTGLNFFTANALSGYGHHEPIQHRTLNRTAVYYHCLPLKYVTYGTIMPHDDPSIGNRPAYEWLGTYCGYCPQIWLSRANIDMTGYRNEARKGSVSGSFQRAERDSILFGFSQIAGFPVEPEFWWRGVLNTALLPVDPPMTPREVDAGLVHHLDMVLADELAENAGVLGQEAHRWSHAWQQERPNLTAFLQKQVFIENAQFVVPSLNLKTAQRVLCRNERQKKVLRGMGFIEDRIEIRNMPRR
jgi:hypothetical protein